MKFFNQIFSRIFKGLVSLIPLIIIFILISYVYEGIVYVSHFLVDYTNSVGKSVYLVSLTLLFLYLVGFSYEKKKKIIVQTSVEFFVKKIPFVNSIYNIIEDILGMFFKDSSEAYLGVIEINYGGYPQYGFITRELEEENKYIVFVPTAPNPTNGFVILLDKDNPKYPYKKVDIEPKDALSRVVSLGLK